jgi:hypothetical protein
MPGKITFVATKSTPTIDGLPPNKAMTRRTPEAEAGSHRASGHRIENAPLSQYQMFHPGNPIALISEQQ